MATVYSGVKCPHCGALLLAIGPTAIGRSTLPASPTGEFPVQKTCPYCGKPVYVPSQDFTLELSAPPTSTTTRTTTTTAPTTKWTKWLLIGLGIALVAYLLFKEKKKGK